MIKLDRLTRTFKNGKGIFDVSFEVGRGEVFGFIGPNGAGKSTTIRHLMGFARADRGQAIVNGLDAWKDATEIKRYVGYLPGEIAFLERMSGREFLQLLGDMRGMKSADKREALIQRFEFDPGTPIVKMSKGMKQKVGLVAAFMHDPAIVVLDEPTSGLDPLMQQRFIELILEEKQAGKTIFMSSHIFTEMEKTCDRAAMIKDGRIILEESIDAIRARRKQKLFVTLADEDEARRFVGHPLVASVNGSVAEFHIQDNWNEIIRLLSTVRVVKLQEIEQDLEDLFLNYYAKEGSQ